METQIIPDIQDRNCEAWHKLCEAIEILAHSGKEEFSPVELIGRELFQHIYTLPESISKLKKVKYIWLYGSNLVRIPPEIGEMESLESFDPYTSYNLRWFPYELMHCQKLNDSRVSTRAIFGNWKNRMPFPSLHNNPVRYFGETVKCSVCRKEITYEETNQFWVSNWTGTDTFPMLANVCSKECEAQIRIVQSKRSWEYIPHPHKGGIDTIQPEADEGEEFWQEEYSEKIMNRVGSAGILANLDSHLQNTDSTPSGSIRLVVKSWQHNTKPPKEESWDFWTWWNSWWK